MNQSKQNIPLSTLTTMRLGGPARYVVDIESASDIPALFDEISSQELPYFVLGSGSNTIAYDEGFSGVILLVKIPGFEVITEDSATTTIRIGAGELWDSVVDRSVEMGLSGIECLSAIPGTAGAAPVQNIGAYGQELADTLVELTAYDSQTNEFVTLTPSDCSFGYRTSIFRTSQIGRYLITSVTLRLSKSTPQPPFYAAVQAKLDDLGQTEPGPAILRQIVSKIRAHKLPDPQILPNAGSYFKNAIIPIQRFERLQAKFPDLPHYPVDDDHVKIPTGWLIEHLGFRGQTIDGIHIHDHNALVLVNQSATSYHQLAHVRDYITSIVLQYFDIDITPEPLEIPYR